MLKHFVDTIIAPITGLQKAAVTVVRLSGPDSWAIASKLFLSWPKTPLAKYLVYGKFVHGDDGFAVAFEEGKSYTGEESVEFHLHGSPASIRIFINEACKLGARLAGPGEFTQRAFFNGRIDLTQVEGVRETIESVTKAQLRAANSVREGHLYVQISKMRDEIIGVLAAVEASVDFSEEIGELDRNLAASRLKVVLIEIDELLKTAGTGKILREGLKIALVGLPNAGKSSLLNALVGSERAIVTEIPGTTRDTVEELIDIGGIPCYLIDTAGLRETDDVVEKLGVERSKKAAQQADVVWYLYDASLGWLAEDEELVKTLSREMIFLAGKSDLYSESSKGIRVSSQTREGFDELYQTVKNAVYTEEIPPRVCINARHEALLLESKEALEHVIQTFENNFPDDLAAVGLNQAIGSLGEILGVTTTPDMVQRIFQDFCIGK